LDFLLGRDTMSNGFTDSRPRRADHFPKLARTASLTRMLAASSPR
jgi:hypothetical protein